MPEHVHLLLSEPERGDPGVVIQVLKQRFAGAVLHELRGCGSTQTHIGQARFYDFVVYTEKKRMEQLHYMYENPVEARSCARSWAVEPGVVFTTMPATSAVPVLVNEPLPLR
jgi:REP element-mobilizing transposase RayT